MEFWIPLLSALGGAIIGSAASIAAVVIQSRREEDLHLRKMAVDLALAEQQRHLEEAKSRSGRSAIMPVTIYVAHHLRALKMAKKGELTAEDIKELESEGEKLRKAFD